ncbi:MAG: hypothetical protein C4551_02340 [Bacillota bacterium]|nr:MAG: hypothetical protein C4551_02340 [Bacillota bacterium]
MKKIDTMFDRGDQFKVTPKVRKDCEWVLAGEGVATEKLDGTNVLVAEGPDGQALWPWKRRNPTEEEKAAGVEPTNIPCVLGDPSDKWIWDAFNNTPDLSPGYYEAVGPKIQGNPLGLDHHVLVRLDEMPVYPDCPRTFDGLRDYLRNLESLYSPGHLVEGIVFHHPDGRMAKIKRKDFRYSLAPKAD